MESNDEFARRMRAKRAGRTIEEQKRIDFASALGGKPTFPDPNAPNLDDAEALLKRVYQGDATAQEAWIGRGLEDLNCPRRKTNPKDEDGNPTDAETFEHARIRLTDALKDMFPQLTVRGYDPEDRGSTGLTYNTAAGPLDIDDAEYCELVAVAEQMGAPLFTDAGWPTTKGELRAILFAKAESVRRFTGPVEPTPGITEEPVEFVAMEPTEEMAEVKEIAFGAHGPKPADYGDTVMLGRASAGDIQPVDLKDTVREVLESLREEEQVAEPAPEPEKKPWWKRKLW
jgi:hypothetical protein